MRLLDLPIDVFATILDFIERDRSSEKQLVFAFLPQCAFRHSQAPLAFVKHTPNLRRLELMTPLNAVWSSELMKLRLRSFCAINLPVCAHVSKLDMSEMEDLELRLTGNIPVEDLISLALALRSSAPNLRRLRLEGTIYELERVLDAFYGVDVVHVETVSQPCMLGLPFFAMGVRTFTQAMPGLPLSHIFAR